jgi:hypothetical protein
MSARAVAGPPVVLPAPIPDPPPEEPSPPAAEEPERAVDPAEPPTEETEVDFEEEERRSDQQSAQIKASAGGGGAGDTSMGIKLFVDLLAIHKLGQKSFAFLPNHTYVFVMAQVSDELQFIIHVSDNPIFFELQWDPLPGLSLKAGKLLVPFGTNEFHHILGGRVDAQSFFLPETWGDFGVAVNHNAFDTDWASLEYTVYAVNGFQGVDAPIIGAGTGIDNNYFKALGTREKLTLFSSYVITTSVYFDIWDADNSKKVLFYALGGEARRGFIGVPVLNRLRLRAEWGRGEIELPSRNLQVGLIGPFAVARTGFYGEATYWIVDTLAFRVRTGRINKDNTATAALEEDLWLLEPAFLYTVAKGKVQLTLAYQSLLPAGRQVGQYDPLTPGDVLYGKVFLQF